jgi:urease accessory protein
MRARLETTPAGNGQRPTRFRFSRIFGTLGSSSQSAANFSQERVQTHSREQPLFLRAATVIRAPDRKGQTPFDVAVLAHDERHLRRKKIDLRQGERLLVDFPEALALGQGDLLPLDDGRFVEVVAPREKLYDIRARDARHLTELAWHIGNRHLPAAIEAGRILIQRDHVIKAMLEGLGATVTDVDEPFEPARGAYSGHGHLHSHE